ncbi:MAG: ATP-binding cassette domain-containing protein, partial [Pseudomonadota bacterium]
MTLVSVENVTVARGGRVVLTGVSFSINSGQGVILRGPNGIGKTTLLRAIAGLAPVAAGTIKAPDVAYASHADAIKQSLSVYENLIFWKRLFR